MSASNILEGALLNLIFTNANTGIGIGDGNGLIRSGTTGSLYISLHTADPTESGTQTSSEANYTSYTRVAVSRAGASWTFQSPGGNAFISNANPVSFPTATGGSSNATFFGIGTDLTGTGNLLFSGATTSFLNISNNITPSYAANTLIIYCD